MPPAIDFRAVSFHRPRTFSASVDGEGREQFDLGTDWASYRLELPGGRRRHRVSLEAHGCESPLALDLGRDGRCLSFKISGLPLERRELFDLLADPFAGNDLSTLEVARLRALLQRLTEGYTHATRAEASESTLSGEQIRQLKALGYLQ